MNSRWLRRLSLLTKRTAIVRQARIALGGVATVPWRSQAAENALLGKPINEHTTTAAADAAFADAKGHGDNDFKIAARQAHVASRADAGGRAGDLIWRTTLLPRRHPARRQHGRACAACSMGGSK